MDTVDRILVIDDDVELCTLVGEYLAPEGFLVECAHDGKRGLEAAVTGEHLLVVLDEKVLAGNGSFEATLSVMRALNQKAFWSEILSHKGAEFYVVVDDQNA